MSTSVFEDFSQGELGALDPSKVPPGFFKGSNVVLYRTGALGPRGGLKTFNLGRSPTGDIHMFGFTDAKSRSLVWQEGLAVYGSDPAGGGTPFTWGNVDIQAAVPNPFLDAAKETTLFATPGGLVWAIAHFRAAAPMVSIALAQTAGGTAVGIYELNALTNEKPSDYPTDTTPDGRRLKWSDAADFSLWPGFQDIMFGGEIVFMAPIKNYLVLATSNGQWYVITNTLGVNHRVRRVNGSTLSPPYMAPHSFVAPGDDLIYALSPQGNYPITFDGVEPSFLRYLSLTPDTPLDSYIPNSDRDAGANNVLALAGDGPSGVVLLRPNTVNKALVKHNGIWSKWAFETAVSNYGATNKRGRLWFFNRSTPSAQTCMSMDMNLDRPAFTSDTFSQPGDMSTTPFDCYVELPEVWAKDSTELRVSEVTVDIQKWNTGAPVDNRVQATLTVMGRGQSGNTGAAADKTVTVTWTQAGASSPTTQDGQADRIKFNFGAQGPAAGWKLRLAGLRGVAIRRVTVKYDGEPRETRGWA